MPSLLRMAALGLLPCIALAADRPAAKPGLWEMTRESTYQMPAIPEELLAKLPPEKRARLEAAGAGGPGSSKSTYKKCVTEKDLDRLYQDNDERARHCQRTTVSQSATAGEVKFTCEDPKSLEPSMHGTVKWRLTSPEAAIITTEMSGGPAEHPISGHSQITAKWLGASCGSVKPDSASE